MENKTTINVRLNNTIFKCMFDGKWHNLADTKAYAVAVAIGIIPQGNQMSINMESQLLCEFCWNANLENKNADSVNLKEPSQIITAAPGALNNIKKPSIN